MKKVKMLSVCIIVLAVIAIGVVSGKQMFRYLEASSSQGTSRDMAGTSTDSATVTGTGVRTQVLYSASEDNSVPSPETKSRFANDRQQATMVPSVMVPENPAAGTSQAATVAPPKAATPELAFDPQGEPWAAFATGNGTNVREGPGLTHKFMWKVSKGTKGAVLEKKDGWTHVKWDFNRKSGWVRDDLLLQGPTRLVINLMQGKGGIASVTAESLVAANQKMAKAALKTSSAIAKPAPVSETVKGYAAGMDLPKHGTIFATSMANIRTEPSIKAPRITRLPKGVTVEIKSVKKVDRYHWFEIRFNQGKKSGWTREDNLKF